MAACDGACSYHWYAIGTGFARAVTVKVAAVPAQTFWNVGCTTTSRKLTVSVATALGTDPALFETITRNCAPLSVAATVNWHSAFVQAAALPQVVLDSRCH